MTVRPIAAVVYVDGIYPDRVIANAIGALQERGVPLAGVLQVEAERAPGRHPCDMLLKDLASDDVLAIAEYRGKHAAGCRLDVGLLAEMSEAVSDSLHGGEACLLVVNKFGKIEVDGGGLRTAIAEAVDLGVPVLIGVPARNLESWRAFAGPLAVELPVDAEAVSTWLGAHGLCGEPPVIFEPAETAPA